MINPSARYATINYDRLHRLSEFIFSKLMVRLRVRFKIDRKE